MCLPPAVKPVNLSNGAWTQIACGSDAAKTNCSLNRRRTLSAHFSFAWNSIDILPVVQVNRHKSNFCGGETEWSIILAWGPAELIISF
jgi:hypothetical protein